jgi:peroxiredoxin Q/BCP
VEALEFSERAPQFAQAGAKVFGLSKDSLKSHHGFIAKKGLTVPLLSDPSTEAIKALGAWGVKKLYGKESEGVVRSTVLVAPDGTVARHWPKAASAGHAQEVLDAVRDLAGK